MINEQLPPFFYVPCTIKDPLFNTIEYLLKRFGVVFETGPTPHSNGVLINFNKRTARFVSSYISPQEIKFCTPSTAVTLLTKRLDAIASKPDPVLVIELNHPWLAELNGLLFGPAAVAKIQISLDDQHTLFRSIVDSIDVVKWYYTVLGWDIKVDMEDVSSMVISIQPITLDSPI